MRVNGSAPRRRGSEWERRVRDYFRARGYDAERRYGAGRGDDVGDLVVGAWVPLLIECKAVQRSERSLWLDAARRKLPRLDRRAVPVIVERRRSHDVSRAYVTLDLAGFCDLIDQVAARVAHLDERDDVG